MSIIKENKKELVSSSGISDDVILKSLILIDAFDIESDIFSDWNNLLLSRTQNTKFVAPHIHIFTPSNMNIQSIEIEQHIISEDNLLIEMIKTILDFKELSSRIVIVTSNEVFISQMKKIEKHFELIFVKNNSTFLKRLIKLIQ